MNLCESMGSLGPLWFFGPKVYFDCITADENILMSDRPKKTIQSDLQRIQFHEYGYNYTKTFMDTSDFVSEPFTIYEYDFGNSTQDWCPGEPRPEVLVTSKYKDDSLEGLIEKSNRELLSKLEKINAQQNATVDINAALLQELKKVSATADKLATHLEQNMTTVNNYYYNQLNVTEFLKFLKQN